jgi:asparagine synthase (glutamine-hydrolysing)
MCGISGVYAPQITSQQEELIQAVLASQTSRGPDHASSTMIKGKHSQTLLAHNRLSIIDLSNQANQPMWDATGRYVIVFNGEIYNYIELRQELKDKGYAFNTASDTEVILNAFACWGVESLSRMHGPFAFALYDQQTENLWLCRDRFGVRPLFYSIQNDFIFFASSTPVLARQLNLKPNLSYVAKGLQYLVYEDDTDSTAYEKLYSVRSGSYLEISIRDNQRLLVENKQYYNLKQNVETLIADLPIHHTPTLLDMINQRLDNAVKIRLRSDVPLAISLSSGLDSSTVAAFVNRQHPNTIGFSFGHPDDKQSEGPLVAECAKFLNMPMQYVSPTADEMIAALYHTLDIQDAPFSTISIIAQNLLYKRVRASGIKVLFGGQGGDEGFMGYKKYLLFRLQRGLQQKEYLLTAKHFMQTIPMLMAEVTSFKSYWQHRHRYQKGQQHNEQILRLPTADHQALGYHDDVLWKRQLRDITQFSLPTLLRYEDRNAMGNSVESRLPFMDHQLLELGLALPETLKLRSGYGKWAIRKIAQNQIPDDIRLARYKRGFDISLPPLIKAGLGSSIRTSLHQHRASTHEFMQSHASIDTIFSDDQLGASNKMMAQAISLLWLNKVTS